MSVNVQWTATQSLSGTIELVQNGAVVATLATSAGPGAPATLSTTVNFSRSGWLAARRMDGNGHQVHTAAVFVIVDGAPIRASVADAQFFVEWIDNLLDQDGGGRRLELLLHDAGRAAARARYQAAKDAVPADRRGGGRGAALRHGRRPRGRGDERAGGHGGDRDVQRAAGAGHGERLHLRAARRRRRAGAGDGHLERGDDVGRPPAHVRPRLLDHVHGHGQGRRRRRARTSAAPRSPPTSPGRSPPRPRRRPAATSLWEGGGTPADANANDGQPIEVGREVPLVHRRLHHGDSASTRGAADAGTHVGHLWSSGGHAARHGHLRGRDGLRLAGGAAALGRARSRPTRPTWRRTTPRPGYYVGDGRLLRAGGHERPADGARGRDRRGKRRLPVRCQPASRPSSYAASNYWVDVVFSAEPPGRTRPRPPWWRRPRRTALRACSLGANVSASFSEPLAPATVTGTTVELRDPGGQLVPATVTWDAATSSAVLDPTAAWPTRPPTPRR